MKRRLQYEEEHKNGLYVFPLKPHVHGEMTIPRIVCRKGPLCGAGRYPSSLLMTFRKYFVFKCG